MNHRNAAGFTFRNRELLRFLADVGNRKKRDLLKVLRLIRRLLVDAERLGVLYKLVNLLLCEAFLVRLKLLGKRRFLSLRYAVARKASHTELVLMRKNRLTEHLFEVIGIDQIHQLTVLADRMAEAECGVVVMEPARKHRPADPQTAHRLIDRGFADTEFARSKVAAKGILIDSLRREPLGFAHQDIVEFVRSVAVGSPGRHNKRGLS